jgi:hypothetical protein
MINMENSNDVQNTTNVGNEVLADVTNRTYSVDEVKILLEQQKQVCANEFIHAEMTIEQAKRRVLNAPTMSF